jgi:hypothetical protein
VDKGFASVYGACKVALQHLVLGMADLLFEEPRLHQSLLQMFFF